MKPKPKLSVMEKKIVPNPRYSKVENVVDTGNNLRKELERLLKSIKVKGSLFILVSKCLYVKTRDAS